MSTVLDQPRERGKFAHKSGLPAALTLPVLGGPPPGAKRTATGGNDGFDVVLMHSGRTFLVHTKSCKPGGVPLGRVTSLSDIRQALAVARELVLDERETRELCHMCILVRLA